MDHDVEPVDRRSEVAVPEPSTQSHGNGGPVEAEYLKLQDIIEHFDDRALTIKAWSVTLCTAGIGAGCVERRPALFGVSGCAALMFWAIEALWKSHQQALYPRVDEIESASQSGNLGSVRPFNIAGAWRETWRQQHSAGYTWRRIAWWPHVALPHAVVAVGGISLLVLHLIGIPIGASS